MLAPKQRRTNEKVNFDIFSLSFSFIRDYENFANKNTIESLSVRAGCTLELYQDSDYSDNAKTFAAPVGKNLHHTLDRDMMTRSMDDDAESLKCYCN